MGPTPSPLAEAFAGLRRALVADAQEAGLRAHATIGSITLALVLSLLDALVALAGPAAPSTFSRPNTRYRRWTLGRALELRRARLAARRSPGRRRIATWRARNRGARALPASLRAIPHPNPARAPPRSTPV